MSDIPKARAAIKKLITELRQAADDLEALLGLMTREKSVPRKEEYKKLIEEQERRWLRRG